MGFMDFLILAAVALAVFYANCCGNCRNCGRKNG